MEYVTIAKLQSKLEGEANQTTVRKIVNKMALDGFIEAKANRRLGLCCRIKNNLCLSEVYRIKMRLVTVSFVCFMT